MAKSFVMQALRIFSLEEMLSLSQARVAKTSLLKKAAGEDLVVWNDAPEKAPSKHEDNLLPFKKPSSFAKEAEPQAQAENSGSENEASTSVSTTDFLLWQRELTKETSIPTKKDAFKGYSRATEMYIVKSSTPEGKEKIRFASTRGVLVNKKQA